MAEFEYVPDPVPETNEDPTLGDYGKSVASSFTGGVFAPIAANVRYDTQDDKSNTGKFANEMARILQRHLNVATDNINESRTEVARKRAEAAITSSEFWEHPISSTFLQGAGMTGPMVAAVVSGPVGAALVSGALARGSYLNDIDRKLDASSDAELRANIYYQTRRSMGLDEQDARADLKRQLVNGKDFVNFAVGALAGAFGPAGKAAAGLSGRTAVGLASKESGLATRAGFGALEGAGTEAVQEGVQNYTTQTTLIESTRQKDFDQEQLVNSVLGGAYLGGVFGGGVGAVTGGKGKAKADEIKAKRAVEEGAPEVTPEVKPEDVISQNQNGRTGEAVPPVETAPVGNEQNEPTRSETESPKRKGSKNETKGKEVVAEVVEPGAPTAAEAAAVADKQQRVQPQPEIPNAPEATPAEVGRPAGAEPIPVNTSEVNAAPKAAPNVFTPPNNVAQYVDDYIAGKGRDNPAYEQFAANNPAEIEAEFQRRANLGNPSPVETPQAPVQRTGRVLENVSPEAQQRAQANAEIIQKNLEAGAQADVKQAKKEAEAASRKARGTLGKRNVGPKERALRDEQEQVAKEVFNKHYVERDASKLPVSREERDAMAKQIGDMLGAAAERGLVDRETLPQDLRDRVFRPSKKDKETGEKIEFKPYTDEEYRAAHLSIPAKATAGKGHAMLLREAMAIKKILEKKAPLIARDKERLRKFISEELEFKKSGTGELMAARRREDGERESRKDQGEVEKLAKGVTPKPNAQAIEDLRSEDHLSPEERLEREAERNEDAMAVDPDAEPIEQGKSVKHINVKPAERVKLNAAEARAARKAALASVGKGKAKAEEIKAKVEPAVKATSDEPVTSKGKREDAFKAEELNDDADAWLRANDSNYRRLDRRDKPSIQIIHPSSDFLTLAHASGATDVHHLLAANGIDSSHVLASRTLGEALRDADLSQFEGLPSYVLGFVRRRLVEIVDSVPVHIITPKGAAALEGHIHPRDTAWGSYYPNPVQDGLNQVYRPFITIRSDQRKNAQVLIHEAVHAALFHKVENSPAFRNRIRKLMRELDYKVNGDRNYSRDNFKWVSDQDAVDYALSNVHEFVAEALSNPDMQRVMSELTISPQLAKQLALDNNPASKKWTLWGAFVAKVRETLGLKNTPKVHSFLEETLKVIAPALEDVRRDRIADGTFKQFKTNPNAQRLDFNRAEAKERATDLATNVSGRLRRFKDKLSSAWMLKERENDTFGPSRPLNRLFDERAKQEREKDRILNAYGGAEVTRAIARAEREHPEAMAKAKDILFDASLHDVDLSDNATNEHLGKDALMGIQAKKQLPRLQAAWNSRELDPVRNTILQAVKFYRDIHNEVSRDTITNILAEANIRDKGLADRIFRDGVTDEDRAAWKNNKLVDALDSVKALKERKGWYVPFRRYGEFVSTAEHELTVPKNATKINDNTVQFHDPNKGSDTAARRMVEAYLEQDSHTPQDNLLTPVEVRKVFVDKNNPTKIIEAENPDAIPAYRASMQTQHTELHATEAAARKNAEALNEQGLLNARNHKREEAYNNERNIQGAMGTILRSLEKQQRYINADSASRAAMREMFHDLTLGLSGTTSIKNSMRQRRNVAGMSHDLGRVTADYARMTANHLARLRYRPKIDQIFAEMREYMKAHKYDKDNLRREEVYQEFNDRFYGKAAAAAEDIKPGPIKRLLQMSRLSRLAGVSFHVINSQEPWTTSLPFIAGRHGTAQTMRQLKDAYNIIGARSGVMAGLRDTARAYHNDSGFTDYVKMFKDNIRKSSAVGGDKARRLMDLLDYMDARNLFGNDSIFEVGKSANPNSNVAGRALDRADLMANQVGSAIEAINRTVTGLSAYNLEYRRNGGNHEAAMHYAYSTAHATMGDYSHWNASPLFNTKGGQVALQFKKFGHKMYYLLGNTMRGALAGDREAQKQFVGLMVTHAMVAGALGLPLEPFKVALMAANMFGVTGFTPEDFEDTVRRLAARTFGAKGGELVSKGIWRAAGVEVSGRMGLDTLLTHGSPKSQKAADIKSWLFDTMAGAPAGYLLDQVAAAQALAKGDLPTAIEKASPLRVISDVAKAVHGAAAPRTNDAGKKIQEQLTPYQAAVRALGFTPAAVAEQGAMRGTVARAQKAASTERASLINAWVNAKPGDKLEAWKRVQSYNKDKDRDQQISMSDLTRAAQRRQREGDEIRTSKRDKYILDRAKATYNP